jgi:peptidoglycan/LPS O-acetylase OafA/YrhL
MKHFGLSSITIWENAGYKIGENGGGWTMRFLWRVFLVAAAIVVLAIVIPLLHLLLVAAIVVAAAVFLMAVWKTMFGPRGPSVPNGGPQLNP